MLLVKENIKYFVNLSSSEELPVSMIEIQSFRIPIVATDVGGVKEIVKYGTSILLFQNSFAKEVVEKIFL